jgi:hypothetical protein
LIVVESLKTYADSLPPAQIAPPRKRLPKRQRNPETAIA